MHFPSIQFVIYVCIYSVSYLFKCNTLFVKNLTHLVVKKYDIIAQYSFKCYICTIVQHPLSVYICMHIHIKAVKDALWTKCFKQIKNTINVLSTMSNITSTTCKNTFYQLHRKS